MNEEIKELINEDRQYTLNRQVRLLEEVKREFPNIDFNNKRTVMKGLELKVYFNNREFIKHDGVNIYKLCSPLGYVLDDLESNNNPYQLYKTRDYELILITPHFNNQEVYTSFYFKETGERIGNKKRSRTVSVNKKGKYITIYNKRVYLQQDLFKKFE